MMRNNAQGPGSAGAARAGSVPSFPSHRSSSTASSTSTDTLHAPVPVSDFTSSTSSLFRSPSRSKTPIQIKLRRRQELEQESQISPTQTFNELTNPPHPGESHLSVANNATPRDNRRLSNDFCNYRKDLAVLETGAAPRIPSIQHNPPTAIPPSPHHLPPWMNQNATMPSNAAPGASFYDDSSDAHSISSQLSPRLRPRSGTRDRSGSDAQTLPPGMIPTEEERRPSLASLTTISSNGSRGSIARAGLHKKLQGFFGDDFPGRDGSDASIPSSGPGKDQRSNSYTGRHRDRKPSSNIDPRAENSPAPSRPRTPVPSSDVVPFLYQDTEDITKYGEAPVRTSLSGPDRDRYIVEEAPNPPRTGTSRSNASSKVHQVFQGHRYNRSDGSRVERGSVANNEQMPIINGKSKGKGKDKEREEDRSRQESTAPPSSGTKAHKTRTASPTPSQWSQSTIAQSTTGEKDRPKKHGHGILSHFRRHKEKDGEVEKKSLLKHKTGSVKSLSNASEKVDSEPGTGWSQEALRHFDNGNGDLLVAVPKNDGSASSRPGASRQGTFAKLPFTRKGRGSKQTDEYEISASERERRQSHETATKFDLDADLSNMEGILSQPPPIHMDNKSIPNNIFVGQRVDDDDKHDSGEGTLGWNAPDSWAVKRVDELNMSRLQEIDDAGIPPKADQRSHPYCIRIFKTDGTFYTLSVSLNSTVAEVIQQLAKKTHVAESLDNYQIIMKKHDLQRILSTGERPVVIQKRLLEQAGYEDKDNIEDLGREDQSYLCRFLVVSQRDAGYAAQPQNFAKMSKFSHVDLSGQNLVTIPIALYSKAQEIVNLNLSRNLSLDLPKDFIQSCVSLRDIKFINNEAWKLPVSLSRAGKLGVLDVSNNRLEQLEAAELDRLANLISLRLANNRLTHLPPYFGAYKHLRSLNVSSNFLSSMPDFLCDLPSLVDLDLSFNSIAQLPDAIGKLRTLEKFVITNNRLEGSLPETFSHLTSLREVDIRYNGLGSIDVIAALPNVEQIRADHNSVSVLQGRFEKIRILRLNSNPVTKFEILNYVPSLTQLILSNAKLAHIPDVSFDRMPNLIKLVLDNNHFVSLPNHIGKLRSLEHFSIARNALSSLPPEIGCLTELRYFNVSQNNLRKLPSEIWWANRLEALNISSNVLSDFPKPGSRPPQVPMDLPIEYGNRSMSFSNSSQGGSYSEEFVGPLEGFGQRRPSQASGSLLSVGPAPGQGDRSNSIVSVFGRGGRQASVMSRTPSASTVDHTPPQSARKDSAVSARLVNTFAGSLKNLYLADNQLDDDVFDELTLLGELRLLNLSYNDLSDLPQRTLRSWPQLTELYLSGNELSSLPADDFDQYCMLQVLHINGNKFQTLPSEIGNAHRLCVMDAGSNSLKYNVNNYHYDWNWNKNPNLKYLNLSGNKRFDIKPNGDLKDARNAANTEGQMPADFTNLKNIRILGLMDVTLSIPNVPDETEDLRVRTSGTLAGAMSYGMADTLGRNEHLSIIDMVVPRFNSNDTETLVGMFDGQFVPTEDQPLPTGGSKVAKYLHENFGRIFSNELKMLNPALHDTPVDALRRAFLTLNKELACAASPYSDERSLVAHRGSNPPIPLTKADLKSGAVATVMFIEGMELYVANVGDAQALLITTEGSNRLLTRKHDPAESNERQRIRDAGGWVSRQGKLNDTLSVSRAFGYVHLMPAVQAAPHITTITLKEQDEMILIASSELWEYLSPELVVDVARSERADLVRAAQRLRDLAMAFGATSKIMVMIVGVSDLKKRERARLNRGASMMPDNLSSVYMPNPAKRAKRKDDVEDSNLRRLKGEVMPPEGELAIVFTDIKGSTQLWEANPNAMQPAIKLHNEVMRRQLREIGGYEVKTEGDAFMVSFPTAPSALLWCFEVQAKLLEVQWPTEILNHPAGRVVYDNDNNLIFRGLSVRMGIHFGSPVCEKDNVTRRMDYFGPMVNKTSRISSTADGGQIAVSADFISEIQRCLETYSETDRSSSAGSEEQYEEAEIGKDIRSNLRSLSTQGFEVKPMGERKLKGLENPEYIYLMYPHVLAGRLSLQPLLGCDLADHEAKKAEEAEKAKAQQGQVELESARLALTIDPDSVWTLWRTGMRLEALVDGLEDGYLREVTGPQVEMIERIRARGGEVTDELLVGFMRNLVVRVEACVGNLAMRQAVIEGPSKGPIQNIHHLQGPKFEVLEELLDKARELEEYKRRFGELKDMKE